MRWPRYRPIQQFRGIASSMHRARSAIESNADRILNSGYCSKMKGCGLMPAAEHRWNDSGGARAHRDDGELTRDTFFPS